MKDYFEITETKKETSEILAECRKLFDVWSYCDDKQLDEDFPSPKELTTRYFKKTVEADEELKGKSANDLEGVETITLRERLLMELDYFKKTGNHLDVENWTLCAGSRSTDGHVPCVNWLPTYRKLYVLMYYSREALSFMRARAAVVPSALGTSDTSLEARVKALEKWQQKFIGFAKNDL